MPFQKYSPHTFVEYNLSHRKGLYALSRIPLSNGLEYQPIKLLINPVNQCQLFSFLIFFFFILLMLVIILLKSLHDCEKYWVSHKFIRFFPIYFNPVIHNKI